MNISAEQLSDFYRFTFAFDTETIEFQKWVSVCILDMYNFIS